MLNERQQVKVLKLVEELLSDSLVAEELVSWNSFSLESAMQDIDLVEDYSESDIIEKKQ
jgi:hypothetical protein